MDVSGQLNREEIKPLVNSMQTAENEEHYFKLYWNCTVET